MLCGALPKAVLRSGVWVAAIFRLAGFCLSLFLLTMPAQAARFEDDYEEKAWHEIEAQLPAYPGSEKLISFFVSATTDNKFFVDADSILVGVDGVVRYTLVVLSAAGAKNVSYEGLRCATVERRLYAFGRSDGTWSLARGNQWARIQDNGLNRHAAALYAEFFCPGGTAVLDAEEARRALRSGAHPSTVRR